MALTKTFLQQLATRRQLAAYRKLVVLCFSYVVMFRLQGSCGKFTKAKSIFEILFLIDKLAAEAYQIMSTRILWAAQVIWAV